jgi:hypothetical protein
MIRKYHKSDMESWFSVLTTEFCVSSVICDVFLAKNANVNRCDFNFLGGRNVGVECARVGFISKNPHVKKNKQGKVTQHLGWLNSPHSYLRSPQCHLL